MRGRLLGSAVAVLTLAACTARTRPAAPAPAWTPAGPPSTAPAGPAGTRPSTAPAWPPSTAPAGPPSTAPAGPSGAAPSASCPPEGQRTLTEMRGPGDGVSLWAILFLTGPKLPAGKETKIVWRMTGAGDLTIKATGPDGSVVTPEWLESHSWSNWTRPGDEWGSGWVFPVPGCWTVRAVRGTAAATLMLRVSA